MASGQERILRRRIRSVQSTKKITRAMELIAASRIVKAQQRVAAARPYSEQITEVIRNLAAAGAGLDHPMLRKPETVRNVGLVVISADRGLAGAYNATVIRTAERAILQRRRDGQETALVVAGRKANSYFRYRGYAIDEAHSGFSEQPSYEDARQVTAGLIKRYEDGEIDVVEIVYTRFFSAGSQRVTRTQLLPLEAGHGEGRRPARGQQPAPVNELLQALVSAGNTVAFSMRRIEATPASTRKP